MRRLLPSAAAVALVLTSLGAAQANTITIDQGTTAIGSLTDNSATITFQGFLGVNSLSSTTANTFSLGNSSPATEAAEVNVLTGGSTNFSTGTQFVPSGTSFDVASTYFALKIGDNWAFFKDTSSTTLDLTYTSVPGTGSGLSHVTTFGPANPVPGPIVGAGLPGLIFASGGLLGWWRRKRKAEAAT